ncbi:GntR family transcriptional regulator [uncultured Olegusella sp.]|uniref:GntR family transcriptional regulator n=1 Tax=uncultured Olegusella sp. TaxID=1979846 RepID=UPI0026207A7B|nr:GntR family transcriptional regulator [uncultured Olegusella sp.]
MEIVISNSSGKPIYEQIADQLRAAVLAGELSAGEQLPSIRSLATSLRISAITTKRAYAELEAQGILETVPGKGCFVAGVDPGLLREEQLRRVEAALAQAVAVARTAAIDSQQLHEMLDLILEEEH